MAIVNDPVAAQYESWVYPRPIQDMAAAVVNGHWDVSDPALMRRKYWPRAVEPERLDILIAGCGANQAAYYALQNPDARVVAIDVSEASLAHERFLQQQHDLHNLELHYLPLEDVASLGKTFDLIVSSGVLHHLADPTEGLRRLGEVLEPHGVISLMLYGYYSRVGVHMLQEAFRVLGLGQDAAGVEMVKHTLDTVIPRWHHIHSYRDPDRGFDAGLVDTYLHPREQAYTVPDVLQLVADSGLKFQGWLDNLDLSVRFRIPNRRDPLRQLIETLPLAEQWRVLELIGQALARHFPLVCRADRPEDDYALDFSGDAWLDYVPSLRLPVTLLSSQPIRWRQGLPATTTSLKRFGHTIELTALESELLTRIDGKRPIIEIIEDDALDGSDAARRVQLAREGFARMADLDYLLYEIP